MLFAVLLSASLNQLALEEKPHIFVLRYNLKFLGWKL